MRGWLDPDGWQRLCRGDGCPLCAALTQTNDRDEHGLTLARTPDPPREQPARAATAS
jgi:hypothetical protein